MSGLTLDGTVEPVPRDQILGHEHGRKEKNILPVQLTTSRIGKPHPVDPLLKAVNQESTSTYPPCALARCETLPHYHPQLCTYCTAVYIVLLIERPSTLRVMHHQ